MNPKVLKIKIIRDTIKERNRQVKKGLISYEEFIEMVADLEQQLDAAIEAALES